ncbi:MAG: T9SS type A sorting domain-containing protein [Saprospiraceae bacterium]|nr:T9SS type A sorting domain-containing protein [Saprospiraceae bacterium]
MLVLRSNLEVKLNFILYAIGTNVVPANRPQLIVDKLNTDFLATGFTFVFDPCETQTAPITLEVANAGITGKCYFENPGRNPVGIDVHVLPDVAVDPNGYAFGIPSDEILIGGTQSDGVPASLSSLISHEMGHALGLFHTFQGTCASNTFTCPDITMPSPDNSDYCDDTPVDGVNVFDHVGPSCTWNGVSQCGNVTTSPPISNFMSYSFHQCRNMFTSDQIVRMKTLALPEIFTNSQPGIVKNCTCPIDDFEINGPGTYLMTEDAAYKSITIHAGQHFILKGRNQIKNNVIVHLGGKLTIDGGILTKCDTESEWDGVTVIGVPWGPQGFANPYILTPSGEIELINNGIIEFAKKGIDCNYLVNCTGFCIFGPYFNFTGGLVVIDGGEIRNCKVGVEFGFFGGYELYPGGPVQDDQSRIQNAIFNNCETAVKLIGNSTVEFYNTEFRNYTVGICAINSSIHVNNNCSFVAPSGSNIPGSEVMGIYLNNAYPVIRGSEIANSTFTFNREGIYLGASNNASSHRIYDNSFFNNNSGIFASGRSSSIVNDNDFLFGTNAVYQDFTGTDVDNVILSNKLLFSAYGFSFHGKNYTSFLDNCHEDAYVTDVEMMDDAAVFDQQGDDGDAAGNCFSQGNVPPFLLDNDTDPFDYYIKSINPDPCKVVSEISGIMTVKLSLDDQQSSNCGASNGIISQLPSGITGRCTVPADSAARHELMHTIKQQIENISTNISYSSFMKSLLINRLKNCYKRITNAIITDKKGGPTRDAILITELKNDPFFSVQTQVYALILESQGLTAARDFINDLHSNNQDESDFILVQNYYLDFLEGDQSLRNNTTKLNEIKAVAESRHEYASNAQAIYYLITGDIIKTMESHLVPLTPRSKAEITDDVIKIYPNPAEDFLNIDFTSDFDIEQKTVNIEMFNLFGAKVLHQRLKKENNTIDVSRLSSGIYIIRISDTNNTMLTSKFIKI